MAQFVHPRLDDVSLAVALHALSDPVRLEIVARLASAGNLNCGASAPCGTIPKSTMSNHFRILRAAGLVETVSAGREMLNTLRRDAFEARFPGLLASILANRPQP